MSERPKRFTPYPYTHMTDAQWADIARLKQYSDRDAAERDLGKQLDEIEDMMGEHFDEPAVVQALCDYILCDEDGYPDFTTAYNRWCNDWFNDGE